MHVPGGGQLVITECSLIWPPFAQGCFWESSGGNSEVVRGIDDGHQETLNVKVASDPTG